MRRGGVRLAAVSFFDESLGMIRSLPELVAMRERVLSLNWQNG